MNPRFWLAVGWVWFGCVVSAAAFEGPSLSITHAAEGFVVSWPESGTEWVLERSSELGAQVVWSRVSPALYQINGTRRTVVMAASEENRFFRLHRVGPPPPGLTGYWALDDGAGETSENGLGFAADLQLTGVSRAAGRIGSGALRFHGDTSRAWASNANYRLLPAAGRPMSVSLWFSVDALPPGWSGLLGNDASGSNGWHVGLHSPGPGTNELVFKGAGGGSSLCVTGRTLLLPGEWRRLTVVHDGSEGSLFLDSVLLARGPGSLPAHDGPLYFGGGVGNLNGFMGRLDDIRLSTNALTAEQVSISGDWRLNEGSGLVCADSGVEGHPAYFSGAAEWVPGREGWGLDLSGGGLIIPNDDQTVLPPSGRAFGVSVWVRPGLGLVGASSLMSCGSGSGQGGWQLTLENDVSSGARLRFASTPFGGTLDLWTAPGLTNGAWAKVDLTYNGGLANIYLNGRLAQSGSGAIRGSKAPLVLGAGPGFANFSGVIDSLKIYHRERDAAEIGPVAPTQWETVFAERTTNLVLRGSGPAGRTLTYTILPDPAPTNGTIHHAAGSPVVTFTAGARKGPDAFAYTVSDGEFTSVPAIYALSVVRPHWLATGGGAVGPRDGSSPERAWLAGTPDALEAIWKTNDFYDCFFYAPGEFLTRGWKYQERTTTNPGCKHIGAGPDLTTLKLVEIATTWLEENIFSPSASQPLTDGFEVHQMTLDCNATNLPKYVVGEPVWLRVPLATTALVEAVTLHWGSGYAAGSYLWFLGHAEEFTLYARRAGTNVASIPNPISGDDDGPIPIPVGVVADELWLQFTRRAPGADFYSLVEMEIHGADASLPTARILGGAESRLDAAHTAIMATDDDPGTAWASGPEAVAELMLPLAPGTSLTQLELHWNCQALSGGRRLGAAAEFQVQTRNEITGEFADVPFVRHGRTAAGPETITFGTAQATNAIMTDRLLLRFTDPELGVTHYSLRQVTFQNGFNPVPMLLPSASSTLNLGSYSALRAVDRSFSTHWASGTQGMVGALNAMGNNLKFTHLRLTGFATTATRECFVMYLVNQDIFGRPTQLGNVLVEDCIFSDPAPGNGDIVSPLVLIPTAPSTLTNAVIRRCTVKGLKQHFPLSQGISGIQIENCLVEDCHFGAYYESTPTANYGPVLIRSNRFVNVNHGVNLASSAGSRLDSFTLLDNEIVLSSAYGGGLSICDVCSVGPSGTITNVTVLNNVIRFEDWSSRPFAGEGGLFYSDMQHAVFGNNVIALGTVNSLRVRPCPAGAIFPPSPVEDCDHPGPFPPGDWYYPPCIDQLRPGYRRAWFKNRNLGGGLLPIRIGTFGVDGPAAEQQWSE